MKIDKFGLTDVGKKRKVNEDSFLCLSLAESADKETPSASLLVVADGIGGHSGGDTASAMAVDMIGLLRSRFKASLPAADDIEEALEASVQEANRRIFQKASQDQSLNGMGTTLVAAIVSDSSALISNVGDSRAYLIRNGEIIQVTQDHSWLAEQRKMNMLSDEEILKSPFRHTITRSLGFESDVRVDTFSVDLVPGDALLLCSDGLYESLPDQELAKIVRKSGNAEKICRRLIKNANKKGGHDNITAVVARVSGSGHQGAKKPAASDTIKLKVKHRNIAAKRRAKDTRELPESGEKELTLPSDTVRLDIPHDEERKTD